MIIEKFYPISVYKWLFLRYLKTRGSMIDMQKCLLNNLLQHDSNFHESLSLLIGLFYCVPIAGIGMFSIWLTSQLKIACASTITNELMETPNFNLIQKKNGLNKKKSPFLPFS